MDDETFLGNSFEDEDNVLVVAIALELSSSSLSSDDGDDDDDDDDDDDVVDELEFHDADNLVEKPHVPNLPRKQGFGNLDEVINYENFDPIPPQEHVTFWYSNKNKSYVVEWETRREENVHQSGKLPARNVLSKRARPTRQTSPFETPLDGFSYFKPVSFCSFWRMQIKLSRIFAIVLLIMQIIFIKINMASCFTWSN